MKFKCQADIEMSPMEKFIYDKLKANHVEFFQEVIFNGCKNPKTKADLRFDFYIPLQNLLIEYDGKEFHKDAEVVYRDSIKDSFAKNNGILLVRLSGKKRTQIFIEKELWKIGFTKPVKSKQSELPNPSPRLSKRDLRNKIQEEKRAKAIRIKERKDYKPPPYKRIIFP